MISASCCSYVELTMPIGLAVLLSPVLLVMHVVMCRMKRSWQGLGGLAVALMLFSGITAGIMYFVAIGNEVAIEGVSWVVLFAMTMAIWLMYLECYSMIYRGFSLHILVAVYECGPVTLETLMKSYGGGHGADWLLQRRIDGLACLGLVQMVSGGVRLSSRWAYVFGRIGRFSKRWLNLDAGG